MNELFFFQGTLNDCKYIPLPFAQEYAQEYNLIFHHVSVRTTQILLRTSQDNVMSHVW